MDELTRSLYHIFKTGPLTSSQRDLRVELDETRSPSSGAAYMLDRKIRLAPGRSHHVLAGHQGSGKSTELHFLQSLLESGPERERFFTVYCDADEDIDRNDVDLLDVLVAVVRQTARQLEERQGISLKPGYLKDRLQRLWHLLKSDVTLEQASLPTALADFSLAIKSSPDARLELRKHFEPDAGNWIHAVNDVLGEAALQLANKGFAGIAILVDDLDKIASAPAENLFVRRAAQLADLGCHVVFTMPLDLAYSHNEPTIKQSFGGDVPVIPMTKVGHRPPASAPDEAGIAKFRELIERRVTHVNARWSDLFTDDDVARQIILLSGGQPTELMTLLTEGLLLGRPIAPQSLVKLRDKGLREYQRQLRIEHWDIIERVRKAGDLVRSRDNEQEVRELLKSRTILQYLNGGGEWWGQNPYIADLQRPAP